MIQDDGQILLAIPPAETFYISSTFGIDLNPDYGEGADPRRSPLPGMGEDWMVRVDVTGAFTEGAGAPMAQFHLVLSNLGAGVEVHGGTSVISIGCQAPAQRLITVGEDPPASNFKAYQGIRAADLTEGTHFFIRPNPWTASMGRNAAGSVVVGKELRYLGVAIMVPNYYISGALNVGTTQYFDGGAITARLVKSGDVMQNPEDFMFPSAVKHSG